MRTLLKKIVKLESKKQSFKRYLLYALGEMALIVLSLLLALQLNQLNQKRQGKKLQSNYYRLLSEDLTTDLEQLQLAQKKFQDELNIIAQYAKSLNEEGATYDSLIKFARFDFNPNIPPFVRYTSTTIETIKQTGHLDLIEKEIIQQINRLQSLQNEQQSYQHITLQSHARLLENYLSNYPLQKGEINKGKLYESLWQEVDRRQLLLDFNALLTITRSTFNNALFYYKKIEDETHQLLSLIDEQNQ